MCALACVEQAQLSGASCLIVLEPRGCIGQLIIDIGSARVSVSTKRSRYNNVPKTLRVSERMKKTLYYVAMACTRQGPRDSPTKKCRSADPLVRRRSCSPLQLTLIDLHFLIVQTSFPGAPVKCEWIEIARAKE